MNIQKGDDEYEDGADFRTYGITVDGHINKIAVYGDPALRDLIFGLLHTIFRVSKNIIKTQK